MRQSDSIQHADLPPIVLFVDDDPEILELYSSQFEASGMWVATSTAPAEALDAVDELRPDLVVTDIGFAGKPVGADFVHTLKSRETTQNIPLIVISGRPMSDLPGTTREEADLCLLKPIPPAALIADARKLISQSRALSERVRVRRIEAAGRIDRGRQLTSEAARLVEGSTSQRNCPVCGKPLEWIEQGQVGAATYDYFRWCEQGCGLHCRDRESGLWIKLA